MVIGNPAFRKDIPERHVELSVQRQFLYRMLVPPRLREVDILEFIHVMDKPGQNIAGSPAACTGGNDAKALAEFTDPEAKAKFVAEKEQEYKDLFSNPYNAARYGYIDDVIEPRNTRFRIIRALQSLATKRLQNPARKHSNIPL